MKNLTFLILLLPLFSCSHKNYWGNTSKKTYIVTNEPCAVITPFDTLNVNMVDSFTYESSKEKLRLTVVIDSTSKDFSFKAKQTSKYKQPEDTTDLSFLEITEHITKKENKIYKYPDLLQFSIVNNKIHYHPLDLPENRIGELSMLITIPEGNNFYFNTGGYGYKFKSGFLGIGLGLEYRYSKNFFVQLLAESVTDFILPFPVSYHPDNYDRVYNTKLSAIVYRDFYNIQTGIGLAYSSYLYEVIETLEVFPDFEQVLTHSYRYNTLAIPLSFKKGLTKSFQIGLHYYPSLVSLNETIRFEYSHTLYLNLNFLIRLNKGKRHTTLWHMP